MNKVGELKILWSACVDSCSESRLRFLIQSINLCLILFWFWFLLPNWMGLAFKIDFSVWQGAILGNFMLWIMSMVFKATNIFVKSWRLTLITFMAIIMAIFAIKFKSLLKFFKKLKPAIVNLK